MKIDIKKADTPTQKKGFFKYYYALLLLLALSCQAPTKSTISTEVLILGEGTGAIAAAIQSARSGAQTLLVNPLPWLGGMLTSAGVSAIDGNHQLPAGLWGEFRQKLRLHYGNADALATGWVSYTLFEPRIGARIWEEMAKEEKLLNILNHTNWTIIEKTKYWQVHLVKEDGNQVTINAKILIDGTDLGDVAAALGAKHDLGMDASHTTGEDMAPPIANDIVQDLTWTAILKDFGNNANKVIPKPKDYDASQFYCSCKLNCEDEKAHPCESMLSYAKLPNNKYLINWPIYGNDYYANVVEMPRKERTIVYEKAKLKTLQFIYYIQTELGYQNLGLATDEFPTTDQLALMPYHREGRRIKGLQRLTVNHILKPYQYNLYQYGVAVGDYPIDHHHKERPDAPEIDFPKVPSFSVPIGALIPQGVADLLIADKAISVTNIVNGASRLQPVILQIGQAAGLMAAMATQQNISPKNLNVRTVQDSIIAYRGYLLPFIDVPPSHPHFAAIQRVGATGILKGKGIPYKWANQTWFYPDTSISYTNLVKGFADFGWSIEARNKAAKEETLTIEQAHHFLQVVANMQQKSILTLEELSSYWDTSAALSHFDKNRLITKAELAVLIDGLLHPFFDKVLKIS